VPAALPESRQCAGHAMGDGEIGLKNKS